MARLRELAPAALAAGLCALLVGAIGLPSAEFTDYEEEAQPALLALRAGDVAEFLRLTPAYGGSLILRSPFAFLPDLWGGGNLALFRSMAAPCLLGAAVLAVFVWERARSLRLPAGACWIALVLVVANPLTLRALEIGHPEELLGAVLCVSAALAAGARRPVLAGALLGLAIANKPWAVLAVVPVLAVSKDGRARLAAAALAAAGLVALPLLLTGAGAVEEAGAVATHASTTFQPWQVWWFLGEPGEATLGVLAGTPGSRLPPDWLPAATHQLVVAVGVGVSLAVFPRVRKRAWQDGLLLLALVMLLRCLLDTWNLPYYHLTFLLALTVWEVHERRGVPVLSLTVTLLVWLTTVTLPGDVHPDVQALAYLAWSVPLAVMLTVRLWSPERLEALVPGWMPRREARV